MAVNVHTKLKILALHAGENDQQKALRAFACWCARQTNLTAKAIRLVQAAESYILGIEPLENLHALALEMRKPAFRLAAKFTSRRPEIPAFLSAYKTLTPNAAAAAINSAVFHRWWANFTQDHWDIQKERGLCCQQIMQFCRFLDEPFPGSLAHHEAFLSLN